MTPERITDFQSLRKMPRNIKKPIKDDKNSLFRVERRKSPNCVPPQYVSQDVAGPQIKSRPASSRPLFKCVWPITSIISTTGMPPASLKSLNFDNRNPGAQTRDVKNRPQPGIADRQADHPYLARNSHHIMAGLIMMSWCMNFEMHRLVMGLSI